MNASLSQNSERSEAIASGECECYEGVTGFDTIGTLRAAIKYHPCDGVSMDERYECDECGRRFPLTQVKHTSDRTVCDSCMTVEDRFAT